MSTFDFRGTIRQRVIDKDLEVGYLAYQRETLSGDKKGLSTWP
jgi:hypothetical protein